MSCLISAACAGPTLTIDTCVATKPYSAGALGYSGQLVVWQSFDESAYRYASLKSRQAIAQAYVRPTAKGQVLVRFSGDIQNIGVFELLGISIRSPDTQCN